jgi:signal recognition particle subunit SEC65
MLMRDRGKLVIWPAYLDLTNSRKDGRILSKKDSVKQPELNEIEKAAAKLGLNPEVEADKAYPKVNCIAVDDSYTFSTYFAYSAVCGQCTLQRILLVQDHGRYGKRHWLILAMLTLNQQPSIPICLLCQYNRQDIFLSFFLPPYIINNITHPFCN